MKKRTLSKLSNSISNRIYLDWQHHRHVALTCFMVSILKLEPQWSEFCVYPIGMFLNGNALGQNSSSSHWFAFLYWLHFLIHEHPEPAKGLEVLHWYKTGRKVYKITPRIQKIWRDCGFRTFDQFNDYRFATDPKEAQQLTAWQSPSFSGEVSLLDI